MSDSKNPSNLRAVRRSLATVRKKSEFLIRSDSRSVCQISVYSCSVKKFPFLVDNVRNESSEVWLIIKSLVRRVRIEDEKHFRINFP